MSAKQTDAATDLKPWAAYVVGRHPHVIAARMELMWSFRRAGDRELYPDRLADISMEMDELASAIRELAQGEHFQQGPLLETLNGRDEFARQYGAFLDAAAWADPAGLVYPGYDAVQRILELQANLLPTAEGSQRNLHLWHQVGVAVGRTQYLMEHGPYPGKKLAGDWELDAVPAAVRSASAAIGNDVANHVQRLVVDVRRLMTARRSREEVRPATEAVLKLDQHVQCSLRSWPLPEPALILTQDTITLFGVSRPLSAFLTAEMGCLWVLAKRAGKDVDRPTIISEGRIQTDKKNLKSVVSRLNKILHTLAGTTSMPASGGSKAPRKQRFIVGKRTRKGKFGPYKLKIDEQRVRVIPPRPAWMKQPQSI